MNGKKSPQRATQPPSPAAPWTLGPSMSMVISKCPCACVEVAASPGLPPVSAVSRQTNAVALRWTLAPFKPIATHRKESDSHLTWSIVPRCQVVSSSCRPGRSVPWFASRQTQPRFAGPLQANRQSPHDCKASDSSIVPWPLLPSHVQLPPSTPCWLATSRHSAHAKRFYMHTQHNIGQPVPGK